MPARALLVLLVMLNLGVAIWWLLRPSAPPVAPAPLPADVPRLQLLEERATGPSRARGPGVEGATWAGGDAIPDSGIADPVGIDSPDAEEAAEAPPAAATAPAAPAAPDDPAGAPGNAAGDAPR